MSQFELAVTYHYLCFTCWPHSPLYATGSYGQIIGTWLPQAYILQPIITKMKNTWTLNTQISSVPELITLDKRLGRVQWWIISPAPHEIKGGLFLFCKKGFWVYKNWLSSLQFHFPYSKMLSMMYQEINITSGWVVLGAKYNWDKYYPRCRGSFLTVQGSA